LKDVGSLSDVEAHVTTMLLQEGNTSFLPVNDCAALQKKGIAKMINKANIMHDSFINVYLQLLGNTEKEGQVKVLKEDIRSFIHKIPDLFGD